jgi:glycosyltransferase involved in cell wall biosynthesis
MSVTGKILFIVGAFPRLPCGVGDYTYHLAQNLSSQGLDIHILTTLHSDIIADPKLLHGVRVYPVVPEWSFRQASMIRDRIRQLSPEIVHIQYPASFGKANRKILANFLGFIAKSTSVGRMKVITTLHEFNERSLRWRARALLNISSSDAIISVNRFDLAAIKKAAGKKKNVYYAPVASSIPFNPITVGERLAIRQDLGLTSADIAIAYFGFISPLKGFDILLGAIYDMRSRGMPVKLLILSKFTPEHDDYHCQMFNRIQELSIQDICLLGSEHYSSQDISRYLQVSDLTILPFSEGASERRTSLLASLQNRLPTITTTGPNLPPEFIHGQNMVLVPPQNAEAISEAVSRLINDPSCAQSMSKEAGKLAQNYSWDQIAQKHIQTYEQVLG